MDFSDKKYLAGAVPTEDGKVVFNRQLDITGIAPQTAIELTRQWVSGPLANDGYNGKIYDIDNNAGSLVINMDGDIVFKSSAFQLDQATICFILDVKFSNDKCMLTFRNIRYLYTINPNNTKRDIIMAENWIVDKEALNKAGTKMYAMNGKFRIRTVQLVDYLTESLRSGLNARDVKKNTSKPEIPGKVKKGYRIYVMAILALTLTMSMGVTAFAAGDPITVVNNLSDFIFGLIRAVGLILLGWGIVQVGLSFQSHDPSQRSNGFLTLAGGVVITFAKEILNLIVG